MQNWSSPKEKLLFFLPTLFQTWNVFQKCRYVCCNVTKWEHKISRGIQFPALHSFSKNIKLTFCQSIHWMHGSAWEWIVSSPRGHWQPVALPPASAWVTQFGEVCHQQAFITSPVKVRPWQGHAFGLVGQAWLFGKTSWVGVFFSTVWPFIDLCPQKRTGFLSTVLSI